MLFVLPLEPLEERYTKEWMEDFNKVCVTNSFSDYKFTYQFVFGKSLGDSVEVGTVLDAAGTNYWKATQMAEVTKLFKTGKVKSGDKFFTFDLWHPALEMIPYMAQLYGFDIEIYGFLHAGSYTTLDFAEPMAPWAKYFELGWAKIVNKIFVGTHYHKNKFLKKRVPKNLYSEIESKIIVTGNPVRRFTDNTEFLPFQKRKPVIIFPHRFDFEKGVADFIELMNELAAKRGKNSFKVVFTTSRKKFKTNSPELLSLLQNSSFNYEIKSGLSKEQYHEELTKARVFVSTTLEENFGYCLTDAISFGVAPVVVNKFSHPEIVTKEFLFNNKKEGIELIEKYLFSNTEEKLPDIERYHTVWEDILKEMGYAE